MQTCTTCDHKLGSMAEKCPHCGQPTAGKIINDCLSVAGLAAVLICLGIVFKML